MFLIRNVFYVKPGKAKDLATMFKKAAPYLSGNGVKNTKIMTDISSTFWTVVIESETEDLNSYFDNYKTKIE